MKFGHKLKTLLVIITITVIVVSPIHISAKSSQEIAEEIKQQQDKLAKSKNSLLQAEKNIKTYEALKNSNLQGLPQLEAEINKIKAEIEANKLELQVTEEAKKLKELERESKQVTQNLTIKTSYIDWRSENNNLGMFISEEFDHKKIQHYSATLTGNQQKDLSNINSRILDINGEIKSYEKKLSDLQAVNTEMEAKKRKLEEEIAQYQLLIANNSNQIGNLQQNIQQLQSGITALSNEQRSALQREADIQNNTGTNINIGGCDTVDNTNGGNFHFCGIGRDAYQGHGIGLSQWGAHGMGGKGFNHQAILTFYFSNTQVVGGYEGRNLNVQGYGSINIEDYVAGQGEVPGRACGNQDQVNARPDKYVLDNAGSAWDCWPEETIKAQIVAFRTYALHYVRNGATICTTASCQVYNGTQYTRWAADETRGQVITHNGQLIEALYSSDNNQGFGTSDSDTRFQGYDGNGTFTAYLRAVNDTQYATRSQYSTWGYKTRDYNINDINTLFDFAVNNSGILGGLSGYVNNMRNSLGGSVIAINFERDGSRRIKKVLFTGSNGSQYRMGGYWFKYMWNEWVYNRGTYDYIYSQTVFMKAN